MGTRVSTQDAPSLLSSMTATARTLLRVTPSSPLHSRTQPPSPGDLGVRQSRGVRSGGTDIVPVGDQWQVPVVVVPTVGFHSDR